MAASKLAALQEEYEEKFESQWRGWHFEAHWICR